MNVTKITDKITSNIYTNYDKMTLSDCTNNENNF